MIVLTYSAVALLLLHMQTTKFCTCCHVCVSWCEMHFCSATASSTTAVASAKLCLTAMRVLDWFSLLPLKSHWRASYRKQSQNSRLFPSSQQRCSSHIFHSPTRLRLPVLDVRHVDGTPATTRLQADVTAEGLVALGATVGRAHKVQWHYSQLLIMMHA